MRAFRIGRTPPGPWLAFTPPPIRGGVYQRLGEDRVVGLVSEPCSDVGSDEEEVSSSVASLPLSDISSVSLAISSATSVISATSSSACLVSSSACCDADGRLTPGTVRPRRLQHPKDRLPTPSASALADRGVQREVERDRLAYPSVEPGVQQAIAARYRLLHQQVQDAGLYTCPYGAYGRELVRYTTLFSLFLVALRAEWFVTSAVFLGLFWHQIMFTAHDAGHLAITSNFVVDSLIGLFVADFCCGLSIGWWKSSHNVHHLVTNQVEHDPDIQNVPIFATSVAFRKSLHSTYYDFTFVWDAVADVLVPLQRYTYYPIMGIARFNLYLLSWLHVLSAKSSALGRSSAWWIRPAEATFMACYWFLFGYCLLWRTLPTWTLRVVFVLVSHIVTMPLHVQITLSHWGMSHCDLGEAESFPQRQLRTTMDVDCPAWLDWIHGGLQFQAVHHLFPRMPRHNLRAGQVFVREFCRDTGIPYAILSFVDGNRKVLGRLQDVGDQVSMIMHIQKSMAETGESGLH